MHSILKSLLGYNNVKKWTEFSQSFYPYLKGRERYFDEIVVMIGDFYQQYDIFPKYENLIFELEASGHDKLLSYIQGVATNEAIQYYIGDEDFITYLEVNRRITLEMDVSRITNTYQVGISSLQSKDLPSIIKAVDGMMTSLYNVKNKVSTTEANSSSILYGEEAVDEFKADYEKVKQHAHDNESIYYDMGINGFEKILLKKGDLMVIMGYTSHGKSVLARHLVYRLAVEYGLNCVFFTFEMSLEKVRTAFYIIHANNKNIFPNAPKITHDGFKFGTYTDEEQDFLFNVVAKDFTSNSNYGTIRFEQPNKMRYSLADFTTKITEIENTLMPVEVACLDYLTLMYPLDGKGKPNWDDYNLMIKEFKNMALTHRDRSGELSPFLAITPTQISRDGYEKAVKNNNLYDISAIKMFSEFEASGDVVMSTLLTPDMRQARQIRIQNLKNRDGELVIDPADIGIDFESLSFIMGRDMSFEEAINGLKSISI